jgi:hypothetical protein
VWVCLLCCYFSFSFGPPQQRGQNKVKALEKYRTALGKKKNKSFLFFFISDSHVKTKQANKTKPASLSLEIAHPGEPRCHSGLKT